MSSHTRILGPRAPRPAAAHSTVGSPGVGFEIAGGDPDELQGLAGVLLSAGEAFHSHGHIVQSALDRARSSWHSEAGEDYAELLERVAAQFTQAAETAGYASGAFSRWGAELRRCRREGLLAVSEAEHWLAQISKQSRLLAAAESDIDELAGPPAGRIDEAAHALRHAHARARAAREALAHAREHLEIWQARGRRAWEDAEAAAERATGVLGPLLADQRSPAPRAPGAPGP
jgi:hypothetical protein